jgi:membrane-bound lytic murein transglycosylase D
MKNKGIFLFHISAILVLLLFVNASAYVPSKNHLIASKPPSDFVPGSTETVLEVPDLSGPAFFSEPDEMCGGSEVHERKYVELLRPDHPEFCSPMTPIVPSSKRMCMHKSTDFFDFDLRATARPLPANFDFSTYRWNALAIRAVENNIGAFSSDIKERFATYLSRSGKYLKMMKEILKEEGIPEDLVYLPIIESGFNVRAYSRSRAAGPWQFIAATAKRYGLKINWWVDERRDPVKSTRAAARYLKDLNEMFNSWSLALASYNAGENKVKRVLRRTRSNNIWELLLRTRHLRRETRNYIPKFIAARTIALDPDYFGFYDLQYLDEFAYDEVTLDSPLEIEAIAKCAGTTKAVIKDLNPELRRWSTPPNVRRYALRIPKGVKDEFLRKLAKMPKRERFDVRTYRVRAGDTVSRIARKTGVSARSIIAVNRLGRKALIRKGQKLILPVPMSYRSKPLPKNLPTVTLPSGIKAMKYKVRSGDTVSDIARKAGVSLEEIVRVNKLRNGSLIRTGQTLYLPVKKKR